MSFILDALKKSESDRQRQSGPALFEVRVASPKTQLPVWALAVGALLLINIGIVGWLLSRRSAHAESAAAVPPTATSNLGTASEPTLGSGSTAHSPPVASTSTPSTTQSPVQTFPQTSAASFAAGSASTSPAPSAPSSAPPTALPSAPAAGLTSASPAPTPVLAGQLPAGPAPAAPGSQSADDGGAPEAANPDDYAPAKEGASAPLFKGHVKRSTEGGYPLYQDAAVNPGANLPQLRLDLHVYAARPEDRFALINMHRVREGDALPEGVRVESINPEGVVLSHNGSKFLLPRD